MPVSDDSATTTEVSGESRSTQRRLEGLQARVIYWAGAF